MILAAPLWAGIAELGFAGGKKKNIIRGHLAVGYSTLTGNTVVRIHPSENAQVGELVYPPA